MGPIRKANQGAPMLRALFYLLVINNETAARLGALFLPRKVPVEKC